MNNETHNAVEISNAAKIASLKLEIVALGGEVANPTIVKVPVTDEAVNSAIVTLQADAREDLAGERLNEKGEKVATRATPALSLAEKLGVMPDLTDEQKKAWYAAKRGMVQAYSAFHRTQLGKRKALLHRIERNPAATFSGSDRVNAKGGASVSIRAKMPAKPSKGKGLKKAKPQQIAAKVSAAGNAVNPAVVS